MIERKFIEALKHELKVKEWLRSRFERSELSRVEIQKTPLGMKIIIYTSRPGLIVGKGGSTLKEIQEELKSKFNLENPILEVRQVDIPELDAQIMAERVAHTLARVGLERFKAVGHRYIQRIMQAGAKGAEIVISGKVPSARAKTWKFRAGYLPKCGEIAKYYVSKGFYQITLPAGAIGVRVKILPPNIPLPDEIRLVGEEGIIIARALVDLEKMEYKGEEYGPYKAGQTIALPEGLAAKLEEEGKISIIGKG